MDDLIERRMAEEAIDKALERLLVHPNGMGAKILANIPSVNPQKTGRWVESNGVGMFVCSVCNESFYPMPTCMGKPLMKYCPDCGAKMQEE